MAKDDDSIWATRDGREIPLVEMPAQHIQNAYKVMRTWLKGERDPEQRRDLKRWQGKFRKELVKRQKEWMEQRNARTRDREVAGKGAGTRGDRDRRR